MPRFTIRDMQKKTTGTGLYLFENVTKADIMLPKQSNDGKLLIPPKGRFKGDSYFRDALKGQIREVANLSSTLQTLITEVPPTITVNGIQEVKVESDDLPSGPDILLCEDNLDGVTILS